MLFRENHMNCDISPSYTRKGNDQGYLWRIPTGQIEKFHPLRQNINNSTNEGHIKVQLFLRNPAWIQEVLGKIYLIWRKLGNFPILRNIFSEGFLLASLNKIMDIDYLSRFVGFWTKSDLLDSNIWHICYTYFLSQVSTT